MTAKIFSNVLVYLQDEMDTLLAGKSDSSHSHAHTSLSGVDTDGGVSAIHHTLGRGPNQAAAGDHTHGTPPNVPRARVYHSAAQTIASNLTAFTALAFNSEREDTDSMHDPVTNNTRLTCNTAGTYVISGHVLFASNATGVRRLAIRLNGATYLAGTDAAAMSGAPMRLGVATVFPLSAGDYVELLVAQNSGGDLNVNTNAAQSPEFAMCRVG